MVLCHNNFSVFQMCNMKEKKIPQDHFAISNNLLWERLKLDMFALFTRIDGYLYNKTCLVDNLHN